MLESNHAGKPTEGSNQPSITRFKQSARSRTNICSRCFADRKECRGKKKNVENGIVIGCATVKLAMSAHRHRMRPFYTSQWRCPARRIKISDIGIHLAIINESFKITGWKDMTFGCDWLIACLLVDDIAACLFDQNILYQLAIDTLFWINDVGGIDEKPGRRVRQLFIFYRFIQLCVLLEIGILKLNGFRCQLERKESFANVLHSFIFYEVANSLHSGCF